MTHKQTMIRGGVVALALLSLAACASKPKYGPGTGEVAQQQQPPQDNGPTRSQTGPVTSTPTGALPGSEQDFVINAGDRVYFDFDEYALRGDATGVLDSQAAWLNRYRGVRVRIEGNADERGTREYNFALGARRAETVRNYLVGRGVDVARMEVISYGKERPLDSGDSEDAYARNRNGHTQIVGGAR
jgi:peptidoglycan-associated lipoprotein